MTPNFTLRKWQVGDEASLAALANNHKIWVNDIHLPMPTIG